VLYPPVTQFLIGRRPFLSATDSGWNHNDHTTLHDLRNAVPCFSTNSLKAMLRLSSLRSTSSTKRQLRTLKTRSWRHLLWSCSFHISLGNHCKSLVLHTPCSGFVTAANFGHCTTPCALLVACFFHERERQRERERERERSIDRSIEREFGAQESEAFYKTHRRALWVFVSGVFLSPRTYDIIMDMETYIYGYIYIFWISVHPVIFWASCYNGNLRTLFRFNRVYVKSKQSS
jgi:hypothetical protein